MEGSIHFSQIRGLGRRNLATRAFTAAESRLPGRARRSGTVWLGHHAPPVGCGHLGTWQIQPLLAAWLLQKSPGDAAAQTAPTRPQAHRSSASSLSGRPGAPQTLRTSRTRPHSPPWPAGTTSAWAGSYSGRGPREPRCANRLKQPHPPWLWPRPPPYLLGLYSSAPTSSLACSRSRMPAAEPTPSFFTLALRAGLVSVSMCSEPSSEESSLCCGDQATGQRQFGKELLFPFGQKMTFLKVCEEPGRVMSTAGGAGRRSFPPGPQACPRGRSCLHALPCFPVSPTPDYRYERSCGAGQGAGGRSRSHSGTPVSPQLVALWGPWPPWKQPPCPGLEVT